MVGLFRALSIALYCFVTPVVAAATGVTLQQTIDTITPAVAALVLTLSSVLGLASLLNQLKDATPPRLWLFIFAHMVSSWAGGIFAFAIGEWYEWNDWAEVALICACAYAGARSLDLLRDRVLAMLPSSDKGR